MSECPATCGGFLSDRECVASDGAEPPSLPQRPRRLRGGSPLEVVFGSSRVGASAPSGAPRLKIEFSRFGPCAGAATAAAAAMAAVVAMSAAAVAAVAVAAIAEAVAAAADALVETCCQLSWCRLAGLCPRTHQAEGHGPVPRLANLSAAPTAAPTSSKVLALFGKETPR